MTLRHEDVHFRLGLVHSFVFTPVFYKFTRDSIDLGVGDGGGGYTRRKQLLQILSLLLPFNTPRTEHTENVTGM